VTPEGNFVRLYPIRYRHLPPEKKFDRWDVVEFVAERPTDDFRPESRHVNEDTIEIVDHRAHISEAQRVRLWAPHVSPSLTQLKAENALTERSFGIVKPDPGSLKFRTKKISKELGAQRRAEFKQVSLLDATPLPDLPLEYEFSYRFTSDGTAHDMRIHDWEVQAAYLAYKRRYSAQALQMLKNEYEVNIPSRNLHFVMGTVLAHPRQFIIIGLLRSSISPNDAFRQATLI
jgi:hypothetical protein